MNELTSQRLLARNAIWNLIGQVAPLVVALIAIPPLIQGLGTDRFGVLTLAWVVIGYFSIFDLGLGRALTQLVSKKLGAGEEEEVPAFVWTALILVLIMGLTGTLVLWLICPWLVHDALKIPGKLQPEVLTTFYLLALSIPVVTGTAGLRGVLEAYQRFDLTNLIRIPMGIFTFIGPLLILPFSNNLLPLVAILVLGRIVAWLVYFILCIKVIPLLPINIAFQLKLMKQLILFGSWMTISNIVGPLMVYFDRFVIGGMLSVAALTYYATPYEVVTKLLIIPGALAGVLFPAFSTSFAQNTNRTELLFSRGVRYIFLCLFPIGLTIVALASAGLNFWLGADFARNSTRVLQWLTLGVLLNSLSQVPFALLQGIGRPDLTAKLHLLELPFYVLILWWLIGTRGIEGAAIAWVVRTGVDAIGLFWMANRMLTTKLSFFGRKALVMACALFSMTLGSVQLNVVLKGIFLMATLSLFVFVSWFLILAPEERVTIQNRFRAIQ